jgi:hypothetical protein
MLKRFLRPLLEPIAAKLDKILNRTAEGFKKQHEGQSESRKKFSDRMNSLSRQVDDSRDEIIRGFARQEATLAAMRLELDQIMLRLNKLALTTNNGAGGRPAASTPAFALPPNDQGEKTGATVNPVAEMMLNAGGRWLAAQREEQGKV